MTHSSLTLGVSTTASNDFFSKQLYSDLVHFVSKFNDRGENLELLIVEQGQSKNKKLRKGKILFIHDKEIGLSRSRNKILENSTGRYVWFLDDDVSIRFEYIEYVLEVLRSQTPDLFIGRIKCTDMRRMYKSYPNKLSILWPLKVSSIEMVVSNSFLNGKNLRFDERIGLGTSFPTGEENLFLIEFDRFGPQVCVSSKTTIEHPCNERNKKKAKRGVEGAKRLMVNGLLLSRLHWCFRCLLFCFWSLKFGIQHKDVRAPIYLMRGMFYFKT